MYMVEENIRVDYNKLRMLIRKDKEFAHDASTIRHWYNKDITCELKQVSSRNSCRTGQL